MSETTMPYNGHWRQAGDLFECLGEEESTQACQRLAIDVKVAPVDIACCCGAVDLLLQLKGQHETRQVLIPSTPKPSNTVCITKREGNHLLKRLLQKNYFDNAT